MSESSDAIPKDSPAGLVARISKAGLARHPMWKVGLLAVFVVVLAWDAAPEPPPSRFQDSVGYVQWPTVRAPDGRTFASKRPPSYPLTIDVLGQQSALVHVQSLALVASFVTLGWVVAGGVGVVVLGLFARAFPIGCWSDAVLTEALTLSVLALLLSLAVWLGNRLAARARVVPRVDHEAMAALAVGALLCVYFAFLRDANFLLLPLLAVAFLRGPWRTAVAAALVVLAVSLASYGLSERESRWHPNIATALQLRVSNDPAALAEFEAQGMPPLSFAKVSPELKRWMNHGGRALYQRWVFTRGDSYVEFIPWLLGSGIPAELRGRYFADAPADGALTRLGNGLWEALAPPVWLWAPLLLGVPLFEWWRRRSVTTLGALAALGVPIAYGFGFATFHAAAVEMTRHMLAGLVVARLATFFGVVAIVRAAWSEPIRRTSLSPTDQQDDTRGVERT